LVSDTIPIQVRLVPVLVLICTVILRRLTTGKGEGALEPGAAIVIVQVDTVVQRETAIEAFLLLAGVVQRKPEPAAFLLASAAAADRDGRVAPL
jgi:hypothetical protein